MERDSWCPFCFLKVKSTVPKGPSSCVVQILEASLAPAELISPHPLPGFYSLRSTQLGLPGKLGPAPGSSLPHPVSSHSPSSQLSLLSTSLWPPGPSRARCLSPTTGARVLASFHLPLPKLRGISQLVLLVTRLTRLQSL